MQVDPNSPFIRAAFYVDRLKSKAVPENEVLEIVKGDIVINQTFTTLLADAGITSITPHDLTEEIVQLSRSYTVILPNIPEFVLRSIFMDGVMHGIAFAAGLRGELPDRLADAA